MAVNSVNISIDKSTNYSETFSIKNSDGTVMDLTDTLVYLRLENMQLLVAVQDFTVGIASTTGKVTLSMARLLLKSKTEETIMILSSHQLEEL